MQASDIPSWTAKAFAQDATGTYIRPIPQTTVDPAAASFSLGFPPQTFTDESAGGTPPDGRDFNGILNFLTNWAQWVGLGGPIPFNAAVSAAGGYPKGARVQSATNPPRVWLCTTDNNTTDPDAGGAGGVSDVSVTYQDFTAAASGNVTVPAWATHAEIHVIGGGGGGAGSTVARSGGGGGAGGYATGVISVTPGASIAYVVGTGGTAGPANGAGGNGATSSFGAISATGGAGGGLSNGGGGGLGSGAPRNFRSSDGGDGSFSDPLVQGGNGAAGPFGGAGRTGTVGVAGHAPGSGGGGGWGSSATTGGAGAAGGVLIRWLP